MWVEKNGPKPDESGVNPPFHHPIDYVIQTRMHFERYKIYPEAGGYNEQDVLLMEDWHTATMYEIRVRNGITSSMTFDLENAISDIDELAGG